MLRVLHEKYMQRCLQLARKGEGTTYPNPLVGSVIIRDGKIIGEGFHYKAGEPHAEVNAINSVKDKSLLRNSTLYVNLEPCAHFGRTPPCSLAIIQNKIPKVVIGCVDTFSKVAGKGIEMMQNAGIEVTTGIMEEESREVNRRFFTFYEKKRPYVILKWAQTLDGFIDVERKPGAKQEPNWITDDWARRAVHRQRSTEQAILVGTNTAIKDNPSLTLRFWSGNQPVRVVIDRKLKLPGDLNLFDGTVKTIVLNESREEDCDKILYRKTLFNQSAAQNILNVLYGEDIQSVIVEGGRKTLKTFIDSGLWDEAWVYIGNKFFRSGVKAPDIAGKLTEYEEFEDSKLFVYRNLS
ncbi:MAG: bifunctional diaminohydroxyphosphoribosylaminopyrimidine deaminase/5-amino-6-(5-phosphoribosylamino)uracil reductase RibD [Chlorobi bacterium]|nr:bifunctional diaminohydroxyphosphoribosylaminopyrimidine deaminase/5-amino-6-(5-phosphoribosylamino)uracil reductase RibD [Chlorobiota bacterium]